MKILLYGINFSPELTGIGKYTGEMAAWFAANGHDVRVITAAPYYPAWKVGAGYSASQYRTETWNGVRVYRTPLWVPHQPGGLKRLIHLASFAASSLPVLLAQWRWKPDVVWVVEPPLMCAPAAVAFASLRGAKSWLHIQDYEMDAAFDLGLIKGATLRCWVAGAERWLMRRFDRVSTISSRMVDQALSKGVSAERVVHFPNWVDISGITPLAAPSAYRADLGLVADAVVALYSGNMGNKQGLEILADVARLLQGDPRIQLVFGGNGSGRADLQTRCAGLPNVRFLDLQPLERLNDWLGLADVHLLPQRADAADLVMPSKLTGMLASGRAVLATANPETELGRVVMQDAACGLVVPPENPAAMAEALRALAADPARRAELGANGRRYAERELSQDVILRRFEAELMALVQGDAA
ncbi:MAG TPA: colanic acid biosynthesis glycosyltransferase WcaI [Hydrogenophaga sp.]|uniref:glycosyltransferase WbuB n=1 Tax=Hydrogenophaga sp. TaxID=1904254 RepID=UPI0008B091B0|nr:glycosyltransferase WbuB [Hydrogenophaga sp.]OGA78449.1 MAG: glycosyl transferase [Burkholderiales bacterium GWE1_65_30]OGA92509.1 MAG: glycosyl transferase [Burkholderiales bacterium GWF1_66_17]HAX22546.1 colanic acid biosynthesis glycosyltransferase WcaI [Hydrogenophaga sp.]HBU18089.1 colanic acid biosynthesis glycosyltransferase WcaI [Hydrogenophaga sp.]